MVWSCNFQQPEAHPKNWTIENGCKYIYITRSSGSEVPVVTHLVCPSNSQSYVQGGEKRIGIPLISAPYCTNCPISDRLTSQDLASMGIRSLQPKSSDKEHYCFRATGRNTRWGQKAECFIQVSKDYEQLSIYGRFSEDYVFAPIA